jgi:hypothetical protein
MAPGFDEAKFKALPIGSSPQQVVAALGQPIETWNHWGSKGVRDRAFWSYRRRESIFGVRDAVIVFSPDWKVIERDLEWYRD